MARKRTRIVRRPRLYGAKLGLASALNESEPMRLLQPVALSMACALAHAAATPDPHSYANYEQVRVRELKLDLAVSFAQRRLDGFAELELDWTDPAARELLLDTRDLDIRQVYAIDANGNYQSLKFAVAARDAVLGSKLSIRTRGQPPRIRIVYATRPEASGLQWLEPAQTAGKQQPFLFSQSQAIHARSWIPLQDTPAVRFTYRARIRTPDELLARMSADNRADDARDGDYSFSMPQAIPSYLLALAVGDLVFAPVGERVGIYAEPSMVERAAKEFVDTEAMIVATEQLYGAYRWGRYDLLVLPPSFPFGGMENPRLTFLTPTVIAGDRSLVALIAHELAHSWSGNLVTNRSWDSFWLNEGFTSYVENRIVEAVFGNDRAVMEQQLSQDGLRGELKDMPAADQKLRLNLRGRDPDDGMSAVAYDKGNWFLRFLEQRYGREVFDPFLRDYFDHFAFQSISTDDFLAYLTTHLREPHPGKTSDEEIRIWLEEPGIPAFAQGAASARFAQVDLAVRAFGVGQLDADKLPAGDWTAQEWLRFLNAQPAQLPVERLTALDTRWQLTRSGNTEIAHAWYRIAIRNAYLPAQAAIEQYLLTIGRRKLIVPLYQDLLATPAGRERALDIYRRARPGYHPIAQATLDALVK